MRDRILPEAYTPWLTDPDPPDKRMWLTTAGAAKVLTVTAQWVRALARRGELPALRAESGQWLFKRGDVGQYLVRRAEGQARSRSATLRALRRRMLTAHLEPQQLWLRGVGRGERAVSHPKVKAARSFDNWGASENGGSVNRKARAS